MMAHAQVDREERPDVDRVYMTYVQVWGVEHALGIGITASS